jgi:hypothetical protein
MKSTKHDKKLRLNRETVRDINSVQLGEIAGGTSYTVSRVLKLCVTNGCGGGTTTAN